ncbi:DCAF13 family protein [Megaselia abdita]
MNSIKVRCLIMFFSKTKTLIPVKRNYDPDLHPMEATREYVRALNATKLERVFAKPFVGNLDGHRDGVSVFGKHPSHLSTLCSGAYNGEVRVWDLPSRQSTRNFIAHDGFVRGICYTNRGDRFITIGDDKAIKFWNAEKPEDEEDEEPINTILSRTSIHGISHHRKSNIYATSGEVCYIWDETRSEPLKTLKWGVDTLHSVSFNQVETSLLAACASDRSIIFYDQREVKPLRKVILTMKSNKLAWNPQQAFNFTVANEDFNLYTFDTRQLKNPIKIHYDHVSAVTDVDYSPTGKEFVTGSYDKTVRIYEIHKSHSREIYHTKRMQRVVCVGWSYDSKYVFSGSDEMNIRLWKAKAHEKLGVARPREKANFNYQEALKEKYAAHPQIRKIARHRHVPRHVYNAQNKMRKIKDKEQKKEGNIRKHSKPGTKPFVPAKRKTVIKEEV